MSVGMKITFPYGIIGFDQYKHYALLNADRPQFFVLQNLDEPSISFLLINPYIVHSDYLLDIPEGELEELQCENLDDLLVFSIVTIPEDVSKVSCNLLGPVLINRESRLGKQSISLGDWKTKHYLLENSAVKKVS